MSSSPLSRNRRVADPGINDAVASVFKNQKFKRMMIFSIKSLADFCVPPNNRYKENALAIAEHPEFPKLLECIPTFKGDDEALSFFGKIFFGITEGLLEDRSLLPKVSSLGVPQQMVSAMADGISDADGLNHYLDAIKNFNLLDVNIELPDVVPGLLQALKPKIKAPLKARLLAALDQASKVKRACEIIVEKNGISAILEAIGGGAKTPSIVVVNRDSDKLSPETIAHGLSIIKNVLESSGGTAKVEVDQVISILDSHKSNANIQKAGSALIAASMNSGDLEKCLKTLETSAPDSAERANALTLLSCMSYISGCADSISKSGGTPLIVSALSQALKQISAKPDLKIFKSITGTCRVLGAIAEKSADERRKILDAQGLEALINAVQVCNPTTATDAYTAALSALAKLCIDPICHDKFSPCCPIIIENMATTDAVLPATAELLSKAGACPGFPRAGAPAAVAKYGTKLPNNVAYHENLIRAGTQMFQGSWQDVGPMIQQCAKLITTSCASEGADLAAQQFLQKAVDVSSQMSGADWSSVVEAALAVLLEFSDSNPSMAKTALTCLETLASERDVSKTLSDLETAVNSASSNPGRCLACLASVNGLSQLASLRPSFEKHNAAAIIAKGLKQWISANSFKEQQRIIKYGCQCLNSLISEKPVDEILLSVLDTILQPNMKTLRDRQDDAVENSLNEVARVAETLCATRRIGTDKVTAVVENLIKCVRKYPETRNAQVSFINSLNSIASISKEAAQTVIDSGALKSVLTYMSKVAMYQSVQVAGCKLLLTLALTDDRCVQQLKNTDALTVIQTARSTHKANPELAAHALKLLSMLVPDGEVERLVQENCKEASKACAAKDFKTVLRCFEDINAAIASNNGARVAARCDLAKYIAEVGDVVAKASPDVQKALNEQLAISSCHLTQVHAGVGNIIKYGGVNKLCGFWESLKDQSREGVTAILKASTRVVGKDRMQADALFNKGMIAKICLWAGQHDDDAEAVIAAANLLASVPNQKELLKCDEYRRWLASLCQKMNQDGPAELKMPLAKALDEILLVGDDEVMNIFLNNKGLAGVYKTMDDNPRDWPLIRHCNRILDQVNRQKILRTSLAKPGNPSLPQIGRCVKKILQQPKPEPDAVAQTLRMYNCIVSPDDKVLMEEVDLLPEIEKLMLDYPNHELLMKACGDYLGKVGADKQLDNLFRQIIDTCESKPAKWPEKLTTLNNQLAIYLISDVANPDKAFAQCNVAMDRLADAIRESKTLPQRAALLPTICKVTRRLAKRSQEDPNTPYGVPALQTKMMAALAEMLGPAGTLGPDAKSRLPRLAMIDGYGTLADIARSPPAHKDLVSECIRFGTIDTAMKNLDLYKDDPEVITAILDFLAAIACDGPGAEALNNCKGRRIGDPSSVADIMALMKRFNRHQGLVDAGFDLLGNLGRNQKQSPGFLADAKMMGDLNEMAKDYGAMPGLANMHRKLIGKEPRDATVNAIKLLNEMGEKMMHDAAVPPELKDDFAIAFTELVAAAHGEGNLTPEDKKTGSLKDLIALFEMRKESIPCLQKMTRLIRESMVKDADVSAKLAHGGLKSMLDAGGAALQADPMACNEMLALMAAVASVEGQARAIGNDKTLMTFLDNCYDGSCFGADGVDAPDMKHTIEQIRRMINDDQPEILTLEKVYNKWAAKKAEGESLLVSENPLVMQHMNFVADYTEEYGKEPIDDLETGIGRELCYGCKCYELLYEIEANCEPLNERNTCKMLLHTAVRQRNDFASQCAVVAANQAVQYPHNAEVWAMESNTALTVAEILSRGRVIKQVDNAQREGMINVRLQLAERIAMNRTYFNNTECMAALVGLWDDFDAQKYSVELLKQVFKTMRRIINDHWVGLLIKHNVPHRLIDVINDKNARLDLLPDVLFLLAALAVVPEIKTMIGDLKGVEACLELLTRSMKNPDRVATSPVLTNDCLALSAITAGHGANLQRFLQSKGVELNIQAMGQMQSNGKLDYDVANAASLLMCNTCFKRDEMKSIYGKQKACEAVMRTINQYDGSEDVKAFRCLSTMFKAIGNLALYTPNVEIFMAGKIHNTFAHLYQKSERLPDSLVEASLRTLSNLAMENTQTNMVSFSITLPPILYMLTQGQRTSIKMFTLAFDVLGCLCRHPDNARRFLSEQGIPTCLKILNSYSDPYLYANGIHVLGIQTTNPASVDELVKCGVFNFLTSVLENQAAADDPTIDLVISACRCIRRLLLTKNQAQHFCQVGGMSQLISLMKTLSSEHTMAHLETQRTLINLLVLHPPPSPPSPPTATAAGHGDEWDEDVPDEGVLPTIETLERPMGPRSWEQIELDKDQVKSVITSCSRVLDRDEAFRQNRLLRSCIGLMAYFACEKIPLVVDAYYEIHVTSLITKVFEEENVDTEIAVSCCYILNNVAFASEPDQYVILRKDRAMRKQLDMISQKMGTHRPFCELTLKLLNERSADPARFAIHNQWTYPLDYTQWNKDKYPNGVQDLPLQWKEELRTGGKFKTIINERDREVLHWKSSLDLEFFQWRIDPKEGPFKHSIAVSRICSLQKGLRSETLRLANERGSATSKPREGESIVLRGLPCEEFPEGVEINVLCGAIGRSRDKFFELLTEWREAAAFGF